MRFKEQIDRILENRKTELKKVDIEAEKLAAVKADMTKLDTLLRQLMGKTEKYKTTFEPFFQELESKRSSIYRAEEDVEYIRKRFERDTINIGVSGIARVGKSTLLQTLSGLSEEQIPTGDGDPVTAVRSQIFNQSADRAPYAIIKFYDENTFINKYIGAHLESFNGLGWDIRNLEDLRNFKFPKNVEGLGLSNPEAAQASLDRLLEAQEALPYFSKELTGSTRTINNLGELWKYTRYPSRKEKDSKSSEALHRLYLTVEDIKIHCNFPSLDGVNIGLIDLPGLGEPNKNVDKIQTDGLEKEVDNVILVTNAGIQKFVTAELSRNIATLRDIQKSVKKRGNFVSFVINDKGTDESKRATENLAAGIKNDIISKFPSDEYSLEIVNAKVPGSPEEAGTAYYLLDQVLTRLAAKLPEMDSDALADYRAKCNFEEIKDLLDRLNVKIIEVSRIKDSDATQMMIKGDKLHGDIAVTFKKEKDRLSTNQSEIQKMDEAYFAAVEEVKEYVKTGIEAELFKVSGWDEFAEKEIAKVGSSMGFVENECNRLRIAIAEKYEKLDKYYQDRLDEFFELVAHCFKTKTGEFIPDVHNREAIEVIYQKLINTDERIEFFEEAFLWLKKVVFDFRQNIYPDMRIAMSSLDFINNTTKEQILYEKDLPADNSKQVPYLKEFFLIHATKANSDLATRLKAEKNTFRNFIFAVLEYFDDMLIRKDANKSRINFVKFSDQFRAELWPDEYLEEGSTEITLLTSIKKAINSIIKTIGEKNE